MALVQTDQRIAEINSGVTKLSVNQDGSVDLYFGPTAPKGMESNWLKTNEGKPWFSYFRWYGPLEAYYDRSWKLPDIEALKS